MDIVNDLIAPALTPEPPTHKIVTADSLYLAWQRYTELFGVAPHGTHKQMAGLLELVREEEGDTGDSWETYQHLKRQWARRPEANIG